MAKNSLADTLCRGGPQWWSRCSDSALQFFQDCFTTRANRQVIQSTSAAFHNNLYQPEYTVKPSFRIPRCFHQEKKKCDLKNNFITSCLSNPQIFMKPHLARPKLAWRHTLRARASTGHFPMLSFQRDTITPGTELERHEDQEVQCIHW